MQRLRVSGLVLCCTLAGVESSAELLTPVASFTGDFGPTQGNNGWRYGYYDGVVSPGGTPFTPDDFEALPRVDTVFTAFDPVWNLTPNPQPDGFFTGVGQEYMHPNGPVPGFTNADDEHWAVIRWENPGAALPDAVLDLKLGDWDGGGRDGVLYEVFVDGVRIDRGEVMNSPNTDFQIDKQFNLSLSPTSVIDLAIGPTFARGIGLNAANDSTRVRLDVLVPEPGAAALLAFGGLAVLRRRGAR